MALPGESQLDARVLVNVSGCTLTGNAADQGGGALYLATVTGVDSATPAAAGQYGPMLQLSLYDSTLAGNAAGAAGGGQQQALTQGSASALGGAVLVKHVLYGRDEGAPAGNATTAGRRRLQQASPRMPAPLVVGLSGCLVMATNVTLVDNRCGGSGGAVALVGCPALVRNATLSGNTAALNGGAVSVQDDAGAVALAAAAAVERSGGSGGLYVQWPAASEQDAQECSSVPPVSGPPPHLLRLCSSTLTSNTAQAGRGGALHVSSGLGPVLLGPGVTAGTNTAGASGGAVAFMPSALRVSPVAGSNSSGPAVQVELAVVESTLTANRVTRGSGSPSVLSGGALSVSGPTSTVSVTRSHITANAVGPSAGLGGGSFGGGVFVTDGGNIQLYDTDLSYNTAADAGGSLYGYSCGVVELDGGRVTESSVPQGSGGGVHVDRCAAVTLRDMALEGNTAAVGAAVYVDAGGLSGGGGTALGNSTDGTAAASLLTPLVAHNVTLRRNTALIAPQLGGSLLPYNGYGGGLFVGPRAGVVLSGCLLEGSNAAARGAAMATLQTCNGSSSNLVQSTANSIPHEVRGWV